MTHAQPKSNTPVSRLYSPVLAVVAWVSWTALLTKALVEVAGWSTLDALPTIAAGTLCVGALLHVLTYPHALLRVIAVTLGATLFGLAVLDLHAFQVANQGIWVLWELLHHGGTAGAQQVLNEAGLGLWTVVGAIGLALLAGATLGQVWLVPARRWPALSFTLRRSPAIWVCVAAATSLTLLPSSGAVFSSLSAVYGSQRVTSRFVVGAEPPAIVLTDAPPEPTSAANTDPFTVPPTAPQTVVLVVVESLRSGAITPRAMPNLHAFAANATLLPKIRASANATHPSWYALFFSRFSVHWHHIAHADDAKSPDLRAAQPPLPLKLLRDAGYEVHVRSGSGLSYYGFADRVFGSDRGGATSFLDATDCHDLGASSRPEMDRCAVDSAVELLTDLRRRPRRAAVILYLDGAHFPYAWDTRAPQFAPVGDAALVRTGVTAAPELLRNRYRSALFSVDRQLGRFLSALQPLSDTGGLAFALTGDHGEELGEHGKIGHDSELCGIQTQVPLVLRGVGELAPRSTQAVVSHIDIWPTLLFGLGFKRLATDGMDGVALQQNARKFAVSVHTSAGSPYLVALHTATKTLEVALSDRQDVRSNRTLFLLQTYGATAAALGDRIGHDNADRARIADVFGPALTRVFGADDDAICGRGKILVSPEKQRYGAAFVAVTHQVWPPSAATPAVVGVTVRNTGNTSWLHDVGVSYHWIDAAGANVARHFENKRTHFATAIAPNMTGKVRVLVPAVSCGECVGIALDIVRENVAWFSQVGALKSPKSVR